MERYPMNRPGCRQSYSNCCSPQPSGRSFAAEPCNSKSAASLYSHVDHMPVAMAYVPIQKYEKPYELSYALCVGTIFPALCKPFCGRRGIG